MCISMCFSVDNHIAIVDISVYKMCITFRPVTNAVTIVVPIAVTNAAIL